MSGLGYYPFWKAGGSDCEGQEPFLCQNIRYCFDAERRGKPVRYIADMNMHFIGSKENPNIIIPKFYPKQFKLSDDRYNMVFEDNNLKLSPFAVRKIIKTILAICLDLSDKHPQLCIGFVASPVKSKKKTELLSNGKPKGKNQRHVIYTMIQQELISHQQFQIYLDETNNACLMLSRQASSSHLQRVFAYAQGLLSQYLESFPPPSDGSFG